jgi:hypothetical protein
MKQIEVRINTVGKIEVEGSGFKGSDCDKVLGAIEAELGKVESHRKKAEFFQKATIQTGQSQ